jgi:hypothetical protein
MLKLLDGNSGNLVSNIFLKFFQIVQIVHMYFSFNVPHKWKSQGLKSNGDGGHNPWLMTRLAKTSTNTSTELFSVCHCIVLLNKGIIHKYFLFCSFQNTILHNTSNSICTISRQLTVLNANTIKTSQHTSGNDVMVWQAEVYKNDKQIHCQPV